MRTRCIEFLASVVGGLLGLAALGLGLIVPADALALMASITAKVAAWRQRDPVPS